MTSAERLRRQLLTELQAVCTEIGRATDYEELRWLLVMANSLYARIDHIIEPSDAAA
jgi:hypothetical protein